MREKKRLELVTKFCDLFGATLMNLIEQAGIHNVIPDSIIKKTQEIINGAIKTPEDIIYHHKKLMEQRSKYVYG